MTPFELILTKFPNAKLNGNKNQFQAHCPAHNDQVASLTISEDSTNGNVLIHCHAGCTFNSILTALKLRPQDLFPTNTNGTGKQIIATYDYVDEIGKLLYQAVRLFPPKSFFQRRPDNAGGWINNLQSVRRVLYRLPELLAADPVKTIFVVEGEKDADNLATLGAIATTNVGGAGKWRLEYNQFFSKRHVVILPDNDTPGRKHAENIASNLQPVTTSIKILTLPHLAAKQDVSDWLAAGNNLAALQTLAAAAPPWIPPPTGPIPTSPAVPPPPPSNRTPTHDELADRWITSAPKTIYGLGDWRRYQSGIWPILPDLTVKCEIKQILINAKTDGIRPTVAIVSSVTELSKYDLAIDDALFDADSDYLVCANGTLHIPTLALTAHRPDLYATSGVNYDYNPTATAPHWKYYLDSILSPDVAEFLQEFAGYCLTTDTSYEIAIWLYGPPGGGKSTFVLGLQTMLKDRTGMLGLADIEHNRFALSNLPGKTLVVATEQPAMFLSATHTLNTIISGETVLVDRKFRDAYQIIPRAKILWSMNELPRVNDPSNGLFRRVKIVEFPAIPEADRMPELKKKIEEEGAGILNWALVGLTRLRQHKHFDVPTVIKTATETFRQTNDIPAAFVADCCVIGCDATGTPYKINSSDLYNHYRQWCMDTGHKPQSTTSVALDWKRLGFERYRAAGKTFWRGVGLLINP